MRFSWIRASGMVVLAANVMALQGAPAATAQFVPYGSNPKQGYNQNQAQGYNQNRAQGYNQFQAHAAQQAPPHYTAKAFQGSDTEEAMPPQNESVEAIQPGIQPGQVPSSDEAMQAAPAPSHAQSAPASTGFESYPNSGCATGSCGGYNTFDSGCGFGSVGSGSCCDTGCCDLDCPPCCGCRWFGGVYGLYMQRVGCDTPPLAFSTSTANVAPYFPLESEYIRDLGHSGDDDFYGAEVRLGASFGGFGRGHGCGRGGCCDNSCGCGPRCAWEVAYWGLAEEDGTVQVTDTAVDANRLHSTFDLPGVELDVGLGFRPLSHYFDSGPPTSDNTNGGALDEIQVRSLTARSSFSIQNVELNWLRIPVLMGGCTTCCDSSCGGCDTGCCGAGGGCGLGRRGGFRYAGPRYSFTTLVGARYMRIDDDLQFRSDFENMNTAATGFVAYNAEADNHLIGLQLGCNGIYRIGCSCRWAVHCSANAGIYGNHSTVQHYVDSPTGGGGVGVQCVSGTFSTLHTNGQAIDDASNDSVATVAELRLGGSYQCTCKWRLYGGYRATGIAGVALAYDQLESAQGSGLHGGYIDSCGSIFLHGIRAGVECIY